MNKIIPIPKKIFIGVLAGAFVVGATLPNFLTAEPAPPPRKIILHPRSKPHNVNQVQAIVAQLLDFIPHSRLQ